MDLEDTGFGKKLLKKLVDPNTLKYANTRKTKLLLCLIFMDRAGRISNYYPTGPESLPDTADKMRMNFPKPEVIKPKTETPEELIKSIINKPNSIIKMALKGKFNQDFSDEYINSFKT
jgi:hypothetical protein